jgi:hypothetical protein
MSHEWEDRMKVVAAAADGLAAAIHQTKDRFWPIDTAVVCEVNEALAAQGLKLELRRTE